MIILQTNQENDTSTTMMPESSKAVNGLGLSAGTTKTALSTLLAMTIT